MPEPVWLANLEFRSAAEEVSALLGALVPVLQRRFEAITGEFGLSAVQAQFVVLLPEDKPASQRDMSQRLHCAPSSLVALIDGLEERGWLTRKVDSADRRINVLVLTPEGRGLRQRLLRQLLEPPTAIRRLTPEAQKNLRDTLHELMNELARG